jgi:hypothetical protein
LGLSGEGVTEPVRDDEGVTEGVQEPVDVTLGAIVEDAVDDGVAVAVPDRETEAPEEKEPDGEIVDVCDGVGVPLGDAVEDVVAVGVGDADGATVKTVTFWMALPLSVAEPIAAPK